MKDRAEQVFKMHRLLRTLLVSIALLVALPLQAQELRTGAILTIETPSLSGYTNPRQALHTVQGSGLTLSQAVQQVRRQYKGRIVSAITKRQGNREVHHIKVLTEDGKVKTVRIQGRSLAKKG